MTSSHCLSNCSLFSHQLEHLPCSPRSIWKMNFFIPFWITWHHQPWQWNQVCIGDPFPTHCHALTGKPCPIIPPCLFSCVLMIVPWSHHNLCNLQITCGCALCGQIFIGSYHVDNSNFPRVQDIDDIVMIWKISKYCWWKKIHLFVMLVFYGLKVLVQPPTLFFFQPWCVSSPFMSLYLCLIVTVQK